MEEKELKYVFVADDVLKQIGQSKADVIKNLPKGISHRSVYAYFQRGQGAIEIAAAIAEAMGCTLNDIYVPAETGEWKNAAVVQGGAEKDVDSRSDAIMEALMACNDPNTLMLAANVVSCVGFFPEGAKLRTRAEELNQENGGDVNAE